MAERFLYLPAAAFAIAVTALIYRSGLHRHAPVVFTVVITLLGARAFVRNHRLYACHARRAGRARELQTSRNGAARTLFEKSVSNIDQAIAEAERAWEIARLLPPAQVYPQTPTNLGVLYRMKGGFDWGRSCAVLFQRAAARRSPIPQKPYSLRERHGIAAVRRICWISRLRGNNTSRST